MTERAEQMPLDHTDRLMEALFDRMAAKAAANPPAGVTDAASYGRTRRRNLELAYGDEARRLIEENPDRSVSELEELITRTRPPLPNATNREPAGELDREVGLRGVARARAALGGVAS